MKNNKNQLKWISGSFLILVASSTLSFAGPQCDLLSSLQSQDQACDSRNEEARNEIDRLREEANRKQNDINQSGYYLQNCNNDLNQARRSIGFDEQSLANATAAARTAEGEQANAESRLDSLTVSYECVGMDQKYANTFRASGVTEAQARANLAAPNTTGMSAADLNATNSYLSMAKKHGVNVFCFRNYTSKAPGQGPLAANN